MRFFIDLRREIKEAFLCFKRNGITSIGCIAISTIALLSLGIVLLITVYGHYATASIGSRLKVTAFFDLKTSQEDINKAVLDVKALSYVKDVEFVSSEKALKELKENFEELDLFETTTIPSSIRVTPINTNYTKNLITELKNINGITSVTDVSNIADSYFNMVRIVTVLSISIILFFFISFLFYVTSAINLAIYSFRKEIEIMQLVGASRSYVRNPFLFLGSLYGIIGSILSIGFMLLISKQIDSIYRSFIFYVPIKFNSNYILTLIFIFMIFIGIVGGLLSSSISVRKYLK
jgi:cell division transport system permease protein